MIKSSEQLVIEANEEIISLNIDEAKELYEKDDVVFVDLRDIRELEFEGKIPNALHAPRGMIEFWIDPISPYHRSEFSLGKKIIFFCAVGWRSALTTKMVQDMGLKNVCHIKGGFSDWKKHGGKISKTKEEKTNKDYAKKVTQDFKKIEIEENLSKQISFIMEIDKLKEIWRQTPLLDFSRKENDAEHSWQLAMMAIILSKYSSEPIDILRVLKMILIHDIVEIDAGDNPAYSNANKQEQQAKEIKAAKRLFGLLPDDLEGELTSLWLEFEEQKTSDALFARSMDRLQPFLHNYFTGGKMWLRHEISPEQVVKRMKIVNEGTPILHDLIIKMIKSGEQKGYFFK